MILEQKILEAKAERRKHFIKLGISLIAISLLCALVIIFVSPNQFSTNNAEIILPPSQQEHSPKPALTSEIPDEQLRKAYIAALSNFENTLKPELNKIDLLQWNKARSEQLTLLKDNALSAFTIGDYAKALNKLKELNQLAKTTLSDSRQQFEQAFSKAQESYNADQYDNAKQQVKQALMLDKTSVSAAALSRKIDKLPEVLLQLEKINTAKNENRLEKELGLIRDLLKLNPERTAAIKRKKVLINTLNKRNFNTYIAQSHRALKQGNIPLAKQKIILAKRIFPQHQKALDLTQSLQSFEKKQRFELHQQNVQTAINADDWLTAKTQLKLALQEQNNNTKIQTQLTLATSIISLNSDFEKQIKSPYHLSNKQLASKLQKKIGQASALTSLSPSLRKNVDTLSQLITNMNKKVTVSVTSDNETHIIVRGVGVIGTTLSKTIQLLPGKYTFEGKRKGYKSKLISVKIPYDKPDFQVNIRCNEPI